MRTYPILPFLGLLWLNGSGCVRRPLVHWGAPDKVSEYTLSYPSGRPREIVRREFWYRKPEVIRGQLVSRRITTQEFDMLGRLTGKSIVRELAKQLSTDNRPLRSHFVRWSYDSTGRVISRRALLEKHGRVVRARPRPNG